ncbi:MAG: DUF4038 domain-containing protein [Puniceicoccaceae bacterium]|nr:MAG: DUF4038 domain-containing protein [Puniceicoccaceae bacterium]
MTKRLVVSPCRRYLQTAAGRLFPWFGDTAWELFHRCTREEVDLYFRNRADKGFTVIQAVVLAELDGLNTPGSHGHRPFIENDPTRPNEAYFEEVDWVVRRANELGLVLGLLPTWGDKWNQMWGAGPKVFDENNACVFGRFLGRRYREADLVWILGGDRPVNDEEQLGVVRAMAEGLREGDGGAHLMTFHPPGGNSSSTFVQGEAWLDFHMIQSGHSRAKANYEMIASDCQRLPRRPVVEGEPGYEDHPAGFNPDNGWLDQTDIRASLYWALLAGACGYTYGCHNIWQMYQPGRKPVSWAHTPWKDSLDFPGADQIRHARNLVEKRPWMSLRACQWRFVPHPPSGLEHLQAAELDENRCVLVYAPYGQRFRLKTDGLAASSYRISWYNPRTGATVSGGETKVEPVLEFQPPFDGHGRDWVLVLEDVAADYPDL